jgi:hypothetical protein
MRMNVNLGRCSLELTLFTKWAVYVSVAGAIYLIANAMCLLATTLFLPARCVSDTSAKNVIDQERL